MKKVAAILALCLLLSGIIPHWYVVKDCGYNILKNPVQFNCVEKVEYRHGWLISAIRSIK